MSETDALRWAPTDKREEESKSWRLERKTNETGGTSQVGSRTLLAVGLCHRRVVGFQQALSRSKISCLNDYRSWSNSVAQIRTGARDSTTPAAANPEDAGAANHSPVPLLPLTLSAQVN